MSGSVRCNSRIKSSKKISSEQLSVDELNRNRRIVNSIQKTLNDGRQNIVVFPQQKIKNDKNDKSDESDKRKIQRLEFDDICDLIKELSTLNIDRRYSAQDIRKIFSFNF